MTQFLPVNPTLFSTYIYSRRLRLSHPPSYCYWWFITALNNASLPESKCSNWLMCHIISFSTEACFCRGRGSTRRPSRASRGPSTSGRHWHVSTNKQAHFMAYCTDYMSRAILWKYNYRICGLFRISYRDVILK